MTKPITHPKLTKEQRVEIHKRSFKTARNSGNEEWKRLGRGERDPEPPVKMTSADIFRQPGTEQSSIIVKGRASGRSAG